MTWEKKKDQRQASVAGLTRKFIKFSEKIT